MIQETNFRYIPYNERRNAMGAGDSSDWTRGRLPSETPEIDLARIIFAKSGYAMSANEVRRFVTENWDAIVPLAAQIKANAKAERFPVGAELADARTALHEPLPGKWRRVS